MDADRDTLATALYVRTDDLLKSAPQRPVVGIPLRIADAEVITPGGDKSSGRLHPWGPVVALRRRNDHTAHPSRSLLAYYH